MKTLVSFTLIAAIFTLSIPLSAQDTTSKDKTPFLKGRWLTQTSFALTSSARSSTDVFEFGGNILSNYLFRISSGSFVRDRLAAGMSLSFSRTLHDEQFEDEVEQFNVGPWLRYYLSDNPRGALYVAAQVNYYRIYQRRALDDPMNPVNIEIEGGGLGGELGMGASYLISDRVVIDLFFGVSSVRFNSTVDDLVNETSVDDDFFRSGVNFFVGFGILLDDLLF